MQTLSGNIHWIEGDFTNESDVIEATKNIDIVFHLISSTTPKNSNDNPVYDIESNVISTLKMLESLKKNKVQKIVFISSGGTVYGSPNYLPIDENHFTDPICSYGISKLTIEKYLGMYRHLYGLDHTIFRLSNPYGPYQTPVSNQGVIAVFLYKAIKEETIEIWGNGEVIRDYIYIGDAIDAIIKSLDDSSNGTILNLGSGTGYSLNDLVNTIESVTGRKIRCDFKEARKLDVPSNILDISKAKQILDWQPRVTLEEGITRTLEWLKSSVFFS